MRNDVWFRLLQLAMVLALPLVLFVSDLRIVTTHWLVRWEYGKAGFPPDPFGLSTAARSDLADTCVDFLATNADISLLANLRLPGGEPAFNERELSHMADVQVVYHGMTVAGVIAAVVLLAAGSILLASARSRVPKALFSGGLLTLVILAAVGIYMLLNWNSFFTRFHQMFFASGTWVFAYSDTLIRLFPVRFWMDVGATIVGLMVAEAITIGIVGGRWSRSV